LGAVIQVKRDDRQELLRRLTDHGLLDLVRLIGSPAAGDDIVFQQGDRLLLREKWSHWRDIWSRTSFHMQSLRDNPQCAKEEHESRLDMSDPGLHARLTFDPAEDVAAPFFNSGARPTVAILREQGVNGHFEMAAAFMRAGFKAVDVHMSDLLSGRIGLHEFQGLAACGGFSYGDVLGAGEGWAKSALFNQRARDQFAAFFQRADTFALGICNGCQMMANLKEIIPGASAWPHFVRNLSEQYEARVAMVEVLPTSSIFFTGMAGSRIPIAVAHGEGRAEFDGESGPADLLAQGLVTLRFVDNRGIPSERYPANPNGSPGGLTGLTTPDGRVTVMMPHPERVFRAVQNSWRPDEWAEDGPWLRLFRNARVHLG